MGRGDHYLFKKEVDWSLLHEGFTISVSFQRNLMQVLNGELPIGAKRNISITIDGEEYPAVLKNQPFSREKYPDHSEIIQIRYSPGSEIAKKFREQFFFTYKYVENVRKQQDRSRMIKMPENKKEYIGIYATPSINSFLVECVTLQEIEASALESFLSEEQEEMSLNYAREDDSASIEERLSVVKVRKLDRAVSTSLKECYNHRCQICMNNFEQGYGVKVSEAHHIEPFSISLNNNADNIIILCPNHHRVIHRAGPEFIKVEKVFRYPNGFVEGLKLNQHL